MQRNNSANDKIKSKSKEHSKLSGGKPLPRNKTQKNLQVQNDHKIKIGIPISPKNKLKKMTLNSCKSKDKPKFHISFQPNKINTQNSTNTLKSPKFQQKVILPTANLSKISEQKSLKKSKSQQYQYLEKKLRALQQKLEKLKKKQSSGFHQKKKKSSKSKKSSSVQKKSFRHLQRVQQQKSNDSDRKHQHQLFTSLVTQVQQNNLKNCQSEPVLHMIENKNFIYYISEVWQSFRERIDTSYTRHLIQSLNTIRYLQKSQKQHQKHKKKMPEKVKLPEIYHNKKTIIFDLDQTLIHCDQSAQQSYHTIVQIKLPNNEVIQAGVNIRPHAVQVLKRLSKKFQIIVFTASHSCYANVVIDYLDPKKEIFAGRYFRNNCLMTNDGMYIKDLSIFNRNLNNVVLVDNAAYSYFNQLDNGIPIIPYYNDDKDRQLLKLQKYLDNLLQAQDIRKINHRTFGLRKYHQYDDPFVLVQELYAD